MRKSHTAGVMIYELKLGIMDRGIERQSEREGGGGRERLFGCNLIQSMRY